VHKPHQAKAGSRVGRASHSITPDTVNTSNESSQRQGHWPVRVDPQEIIPEDVISTARETMLDSAVAHLAMRKATRSTFSDVVESIACMNTCHVTECVRSELLPWYLLTRAFSPVHHALLDLGGSHESLQSRLDAAIATSGCQIDEIDRSGRTPLAWSVEYRYVEGVETLLRCGASANFIRSSVCGDVRISYICYSRVLRTMILLSPE